MKFINTLKTKIKEKAESMVKEIVFDVFEKYDEQLAVQQDYIEIVESQLNKVNRDIAYIAEALKQTHMLLQAIEEQNIFGLDDDSIDKTYH
jgi:septal ring factor EnvC (AmiA/AmiB activator)